MTPQHTDESDRTGGPPATVAGVLRLGSGFTDADRPRVDERLSSLDHALAGFPATAVELELSMKDRDRPGQTTTLQCWLTGRHRLVSTSSEPDMIGALIEVRDELRRQLDDAKARSAPSADRHPAGHTGRR